MPKNVFDLLVRGGEIFGPHGLQRADVGIVGERILAIGPSLSGEAKSVFDATGQTVLPGVIDPQVHFREPGLEHKEDLESGTRAAVLGGVTAVFEMPNTTPPTTSKSALEDKLNRARGRVHCDIAFFVGATKENADQLGELELLPGCCGVKIFMGSSTGTLLVADDATLERVLKSGKRRVAIHAEDEDRLIARKPIALSSGNVQSHPEWRDAECARLATERIIRIAQRVGRPIHVLHVTTAEEIPMLKAAKPLVSFEIPPQHLTLKAPDCYSELGTLAQMNPPIREERHQVALWAAVADDTVDAIATDHAPHTLKEKALSYPKSPSGMPGVQTLIPIMLDHVHHGRLTLKQFVRLLCEGPAHLYQVKDRGVLTLGALASLTIVDRTKKRTIHNDWIASRVGWTPFHGKEVVGWPTATLIRGRVVMHNDRILEPHIGIPVEFCSDGR
jgi:dihydroorotase